MKSKHSALFSRYVIDGVRQDVTPADMLEECMIPSAAMSDPACAPDENAGALHAVVSCAEPERQIPGDIWDETVDPSPESCACPEERFDELLDAVAAASHAAQDRPFELQYPESFSRQRIAAALIDCLWLDGKFRLEDLRLWADWSWNVSGLGSHSAFYRSVRSATDYVYTLGIGIQGYGYDESDGLSVNSYFPVPASYAAECGSGEDVEEDVADKDWEEDDMTPDEDRQWTVGGPEFCLESDREVWMGERRKCSARLAGGDTCLIYVPFDTCRFRLGGSLLSAVAGCGGGYAPQIEDPDYFIDCFEVVRDLVEDGVVLASRTVCDGGVAVAAKKLADASGMGVSLNVNGLGRAYNETDRMRLLFAEIPGALLQVSEDDLDYVDSQFLLQDVAYFRIGRPDASFEGLKLEPAGNGIGSIVAALSAEF